MPILNVSTLCNAKEKVSKEKSNSKENALSKQNKSKQLKDNQEFIKKISI
jgi:hypothetical protein